MKLVWSHIVIEKKTNDDIIAKQALQWTLQDRRGRGQLRTTQDDLETGSGEINVDCG